MAIEKRCWSPDCGDRHVEGRSWDGRPIRRHVTYEGAVLRLRERNFTDDSDFYAIVWNGERLTVDEYATTRYPTDDNHATVDATPEVREAAGQWAVEHMHPIIREALAAEAAQVKVGSRVSVREPVSRGPNATEAGATGRVFWMGESFSRYGTWSRGWRAGVNLDGSGATVWIDAHRLDVIDPDPIMEADVDRLAERYRKDPTAAILRNMGGPGMVVVG
jgi:hypothetical protein